MNGVEADERDQLRDSCAPCRAIAEPVDDERLFNDLTGTHSRIER